MIESNFTSLPKPSFSTRIALVALLTGCSTNNAQPQQRPIPINVTTDAGRISDRDISTMEIVVDGLIVTTTNQLRNAEFDDVNTMTHQYAWLISQSLQCLQQIRTLLSILRKQRSSFTPEQITQKNTEINQLFENYRYYLHCKASPTLCLPVSNENLEPSNPFGVRIYHT